MPASAIRGIKQRRFPEMLEDEDIEADPISILPSAKSEREARKFDFHSEHLQQQGELQRQELDLERERLAIEREKNIAEQKRTEMMMMELQALIQGRLGEEIGPHGMGKRAKTDSSKKGDEDIIELDHS
ncbi:hypothetical protein HOY82DRAFT_614720 [Tuber indicum]|nr:hypothetical protein HOY82DRAFT_614720 [Tuber indicum]